MANYSLQIRSNIILLNEEGYSQRQIAKRLAVSKTGVQETIARKVKTGSENPNKRTGRPRKTSRQTDSMIKRLVTANPTASSKFLQAQLPERCRVSTATIRRRLCKDFNLRSYRAARKPLLSAKNIRDRISFCRAHRHWTEDDWSAVLFTDESAIRQFNPVAIRVRRPENQRFNVRYTQPVVKHSPSLMVWGGITAQGRAGLHFMPPNVTVNSQRYLQILKEKLQLWLAIRNCTILMHDGAPCHQSKLVKKWLQDEHVQVLIPWPGSSPDLNPIENCWRLLKDKVSSLNPTSLEDLRHKVVTVWTTEISEDYCSKLLRTMPRRIEAVLAARGHATKY